MLDNIKVLDVGGFITGPLASSMLGDLGAQVTKIERPKSGDPFRAFSSGLYSPFFCSVNWNKRSLTLDLTKPEGLALYKELVGEADVVVQNFRPGAAEKLGIGYEAMQAINPRLIYCAITGFGPTGPYKLRPSYDMVAQGMSGYLSLLMDFDDPWIPNPSAGDNLTGIYAAYGILGALVERGQTNKGRLVEVTMLDSMISFSGAQFAIAATLKQLPSRESRAALSQSYALPCADDKVVVIHLSSPEHFWTNLIGAIERPDLASDERFCERRLRIANYALLKQELRAAFITKPRDQWVAILDDNDVPCAPAYDLEEVRHDPQVLHLDIFEEHEHPTEGPVLRVRRPVFYDGARDELISVPPSLGEHTDVILRELGKSDEEIRKFRLQGLV
jgi:crotonobetainyl-CoA:carnitine CoA-transferase CaiB-like acyl-CoA transferase